MMNYLKLYDELNVHFINHEKRFKHSVGVSEFAVKLNLDLMMKNLKLQVCYMILQKYMT